MPNRLQFVHGEGVVVRDAEYTVGWDCGTCGAKGLLIGLHPIRGFSFVCIHGAYLHCSADHSAGQLQAMPA